MSDRGPTRVLLSTLVEALKTWLHEMRQRGRGRRPVRRSAAAAAAVTLAAGMAAAPAFAAVDPTSDHEPAARSAPEGVQVAARGVRPPLSHRAPLEVPPRKPPSPMYQEVPQRPRTDPDQAPREHQLRNDREQREYNNYNWGSKWNKTRKEIQKQQDEMQEPTVPPITPYNPNDPLAPQPLTQEQVDAMNKQLDSLEPYGYVNQDPEFSLAPHSDLNRDMDKARVDREIDNSYLNNPDNRPYNKDRLDNFRNQFHDAIDAKHDAKTVQENQDARDQINQLARDFNAAELGERDNYGGHPPGDRVVPKHLGDYPAQNDQEDPVGAVEQGLPPERTQSPRSLAQDDPDYDGPTDAESQMDSPRSQAQDDPGYDGPTDSAADSAPTDNAPTDSDSLMSSPRSQAQNDPGYDGPTDSQMDSARSKAQNDPSFDGPVSTDTPDSPDLDSTTDSTADPDSGLVSSTSEDSNSITGESGTDSLGSYSGSDSLGTDGLGTDSLGGYGGSDSVGSDSLGSDSLGGYGGTDSSSGLGSDSSGGLGGDGGGMSGDSSGDSSGGMSGDSSSGFGGDSSSGMGGDSSGGMGSSGMSSGGMGGGDGGDGGGF